MVITPETWGSGRAFCRPQARRGSGGPTSRPSPRECWLSRDRPRSLPRALLRHGGLANLLGSAFLSHKGTHVAASETRRRLPSSCIWFLTGLAENRSDPRRSPGVFIRPRVGIALCKTKAPFQSSVGPVSLHITLHLPSGLVHLQPQPNAVAKLSLPFHLPLSAFPCFSFRGD